MPPDTILDSITLGIDVSKLFLDVFIQPGSQKRRFSNDAKGIQELLGLDPQEAHLEASGGYERLVKRALMEAGTQVKVHNPRRVRRFADVCGIAAKTDPIDAKLLSAAAIQAPAVPKSEQQEQLADLSRLIHILKKELAGHKKRQGACGLSAALLAHLEQLIKTRTQEIQTLEKEYEKLVKQSHRATHYELALTIPGVGTALARTLTAELPEQLQNWNSKQIASLAGVAPIDDASGQSARKSKTKNGNPFLKAALYMPAMSATQTQTWAKTTYANLKAKNKSHRQAITAIMRKLLTRILAVLKRGSAWISEPTKT